MAITPSALWKERTSAQQTVCGWCQEVIKPAQKQSKLRLESSIKKNLKFPRLIVMWLNEVESAFSSWHSNTFWLMSVLCANQLLLRDVSACGSGAAVTVGFFYYFRWCKEQDCSRGRGRLHWTLHTSVRLSVMDEETTPFQQPWLRPCRLWSAPAASGSAGRWRLQDKLGL